MENFRSMSVSEGKMQFDHQAPKNMQELRSYSTSYVGKTTGQQGNNNTKVDQKEVKMKKFKSKSASSYVSSMGWSFNDPELQRKKRVVSYKVYSVEGKMKGSLRKSFKWIKDSCGWW